MTNAICLARSGREAEGRRELEYFVQRFELDDQGATSLRRIFDDALLHSNPDAPAGESRIE
jgi:hypothetical protein